jgi:hypothetical protein
VKLFLWIAAVVSVALLGIIAYEVSTADTVSVSLHREIDATLKPGVRHGFSLGPSVPKRAYLAVVSPATDAGNVGEQIVVERLAVQTEHNERDKKWSDVLRIASPDNAKEDQRVKIHLFKVANDNFFTGAHGWISPTGLLGRLLNSVGYAPRPRVWISTTGDVRVAD